VYESDSPLLAVTALGFSSLAKINVIEQSIICCCFYIYFLETSKSFSIVTTRFSGALNETTTFELLQFLPLRVDPIFWHHKSFLIGMLYDPS
jgi:hypothetical protein